MKDEKDAWAEYLEQFKDEIKSGFVKEEWATTYKDEAEKIWKDGGYIPAKHNPVDLDDCECNNGEHMSNNASCPLNGDYHEQWKAEDPEGYEHVMGKEPRSKAETIAMTSIAHGLGTDSTKAMADSMNLPLNILMISRILHKSVLGHELWDCRRAPHALFIDCLYLVCKFKKVKVTAREMSAKTKAYFGVGTQPRPNEWCKDYAFIVDGVLK